MKKPRLIIIGISAALIIAGLFFIDYRHLFSRSNLAAFLGILAMVFNIVSMILSNRHEAKKVLKNRS
jgi:hypothetical protein